MESGILLVFEGIDGAGKSTQVAAVARLYRALGHPVVTTKEPTDGQYGQRIRATAATGRLAVSEELALFEADRREHVAQLLKPRLAQGALVIVDRYYFSTAAYQGIRGLDPQEIITRNEGFAPRPDLLVILDLPADHGLGRVRARDAAENLFERREDLARCREIFQSIQGDDVLHLDATQPPNLITRQIVAALLAGPFQARHATDLSTLAAQPALDDPSWRRAVAEAITTRR